MTVKMTYKNGDIFEGTVRGLSSKGYGVVESETGQIFFARGSWPGDFGSFIVEEVKSRYGLARVDRLLKPSPDRAEVKLCPHQGILQGECGGCPWMIANYKSQLYYKLDRLKLNFSRHKISFDPLLLKEIIPSPKTEGYRNRSKLKTNGKEIGFVSENSNTLAPIRECVVLNEKCRSLLSQLRSLLPQKSWIPRSNRDRNNLNFIEIDDEMDFQFDSIIEINQHRHFRQGNTLQNNFMKDWLKSKLLSSKVVHDKAIELFAGSGNFTQVMSDVSLYKKIVALEVQGEAVTKLRELKLPGVKVLSKNLFIPQIWDELRIIDKDLSTSSLLVLNPPREGLDQRKNFFKTFPNLKEVYYISCNSETFARDYLDFQLEGFTFEEIQPIDQFPHTPHLELLVKLIKN